MTRLKKPDSVTVEVKPVQCWDRGCPTHHAMYVTCTLYVPDSQLRNSILRELPRTAMRSSVASVVLIPYALLAQSSKTVTHLIEHSVASPTYS